LLLRLKLTQYWIYARSGRVKIEPFRPGRMFLRDLGFGMEGVCGLGSVLILLPLMHFGGDQKLEARAFVLKGWFLVLMEVAVRRLVG
jgi:hypothetical protein